MVETIVVLLRLAADVIAAALRPSAEALAAGRSLLELAPAMPAVDAGALVLALTVVATLAVLAVALAILLSPAHAVATTTHPRRAIRDATRLTASHPDAPGHSRPRAPGSAALAA
ncbi:hypothetical protein R8Z57_13255 [Microbacterium sp. M3]|uniref:Uncharacterized protein n=1 Tax=Microbacterium arthrosphaerae TaxID=792652 RepID=A0ABU4H4T5_9MICO|nr:MULTISPECIES: DUF6412 domain-containing protein [Microbacterium]MDW4573742.1 hypothetical protein [Microbacterium arthrosphaerae]MDW7607597.1 hypothetical protein [Microbacterium sp. M3]